MKVAFFDATPGADYWALGHYELPAVPNVGEQVYIPDAGPNPWFVVERFFWAGPGHVCLHVDQQRPRKRWWQR